VFCFSSTSAVTVFLVLVQGLISLFVDLTHSLYGVLRVHQVMRMECFSLILKQPPPGSPSHSATFICEHFHSAILVQSDSHMSASQN
jgi:hypothetical protein